MPVAVQALALRHPGVVCRVRQETARLGASEFCIVLAVRGPDERIMEQVLAVVPTVRERTGLNVACELDTNTYQKGIKVTAEELASINISYDQFHPDWNYTINPRPTTAVIHS